MANQSSLIISNGIPKLIFTKLLIQRFDQEIYIQPKF